MTEPLSCYILTKNSERYLDEVLQPLTQAVDDLIIVDSGSTDRTLQIAQKHNARVVSRPFDNFKKQRNFALEQCKHRWVLSLDSDEVPDQELIELLKQLKKDAFTYKGRTEVDSFSIKRRWFLFGKEVRAFFPCPCPDYPNRLFRKDKVHFGDASKEVHEEPTGSTKHFALEEGSVFHYSCDTVTQLFAKLNHYTTLDAQVLKKRGRKTSWPDLLGRSFVAWLKWYFRKGGYKDGSVGFLLGIYAYLYTLQKYLKLKFD